MKFQKRIIVILSVMAFTFVSLISFPACDKAKANLGSVSASESLSAAKKAEEEKLAKEKEEAEKKLAAEKKAAEGTAHAPGSDQNPADPGPVHRSGLPVHRGGSVPHQCGADLYPGCPCRCSVY